MEGGARKARPWPYGWGGTSAVARSRLLRGVALDTGAPPPRATHRLGGTWSLQPLRATPRAMHDHARAATPCWCEPRQGAGGKGQGAGGTRCIHQHEPRQSKPRKHKPQQGGSTRTIHQLGPHQRRHKRWQEPALASYASMQPSFSCSLLHERACKPRPATPPTTTHALTPPPPPRNTHPLTHLERQ